MFYNIDGIFYDKEKLNEFVSKYNISLVVIFGSHAKGRANNFSDIDIGIRFAKSIDMSLYSLIMEELIEIFKNDNIDVVVLNYADPLLCFEIINNYKVLYEAHPEAYIEFYLYAVKSYDDTNKLKKLEQGYIDYYLKKGIKNGSCRCNPPQVNKPF